MALDSISEINNPATASTAKKENTGVSGLSNNLNDFLKLLTTQLKNQDPTQPLDTAQFTGQLIGFSSVEQQLGTNARLDKLVDKQKSTAINTQLSSSVNYIGKMAEIESDQFQLEKTGEPRFAYDVPRGVVNSVITITKANGQVIGALKGKVEEGKQNLTWDGKDANGNRLPPGRYDFSVAVTDTQNKTTNAKTYAFGEVTSVELNEGKTNLVIDDSLVVQADKVRSIEQKQAI